MIRPSVRRSFAVAFVASLAVYTTGATSPVWANNGHSLRDTAKQLVTAGFAGDLAAAKKLTLTFDQFASMSTKDLQKAEYEQEVDAFLKALKQPVALPELRIEEVFYLPAGSSSKRKKEMVFAVVKPIFPDNDLTERWQAIHGSFYFVQTDQGWRLSINK